MKDTTKTASRFCPICGNCKVSLLHTQNFEVPTNFPLPSSYDVVCCLKCDFVYADSAATQGDYDQFYTAFSKYEDKGTGTGGDLPWDYERLVAVAQVIANAGLPKSARILDLGCANGGLLRALREIGFSNLTGVDPSPGCVQNVEAANIPARRGHLFSLPEDLGQFDCVILSHVLEHISDLKRAATAVVSTLSPRALLYLEVPDPSRYVEFLYAPFQDFNTEHINHFSHSCLANLLSEHGLKPLLERRKTIRASEDYDYPAILGLYQRDPLEPPEPANRNLRRDSEIRLKVEEYIQCSYTLLDRIDKRIQNVLAESHEVIVWGTGQLAMKLFRDTSLKEARVIACVDTNPKNIGQTIHGILIVAPTDVSSQSAPILITSTLHEKAILKCIRALSLPNPVVSLRD